MVGRGRGGLIKKKNRRQRGNRGLRKTVKQEGDEDKCGGGGLVRCLIYADLSLRGRGGGPLNMGPRGAAMGAHTVRASGCSWWGGGLCLLKSGEAVPSDVPLTCGTEHREPGSKGRRGRRG